MNREEALNIARSTGDRLMNGRLMPYQRASVEAICETFERKDRALLADEVGLGKTEIAKGVIAQMALRCWETHGRPLRVAYLCASQNVARQNFSKLRIFDASRGESDQTAADRLRAALAAYHDVSGVPASHKKVREFLAKPSVYTRAAEWLLARYTGRSVESAMDRSVRAIYLPEAGGRAASASSEWAANDGARVLEHAAQLRGVLLNGLPESAVLRRLWEDAAHEHAKEGAAKCWYAFNKAAAYCLRYGVEEDYRLSMQHLYAAEAAARSGGVMELQCLTPRTSLQIGSGKGTYRERALLAASLQNGRQLLADREIAAKFVGEADAQRFAEEFASFERRLRAAGVAPLSTSQLGVDVRTAPMSDIRRAFIRRNLTHSIGFDLVVLDEFQNYEALLKGGAASEANVLAQAFFAQKGCKLLMLSATPFGIADYVPEPEDGAGADSLDERACRSKEEAFESFFTLARFLSEGDGAQFAAWRAEWERSRLTAQVLKTRPREELEARKARCEALLFEQLGIVRTERLAAAAQPPVTELRRDDLFDDYTAALRVQRHMAETGVTGWRADYAQTTPFAPTFAAGYALGAPDGQGCAWYECASGASDKIFLHRAALDGHAAIASGDPAFERLKDDLFAENAAGYSAASMLWVPPCAPSGRLSGAFAGREGFSKTLIFTHYRMTPMAFTTLLCHEARRRLPDAGQENAGALRPWIAELTAERPKSVADALAKLLEELFTQPHGVAAVRSVYPDGAYPEAVRRYAQDGCLADVLDEYLGLLRAEYGGDNDAAVADALDGVRTLRIAEPSLLLFDDAAGRVVNGPCAAANRFAVGLFSETESDDSTRRMANIRTAFNSPFLPFVFTSTSIGTEGVDLHWYARSVVHWSVPRRPIDLEQREGRVLRFRCHAFRLNAALLNARENGNGEAISLRPEWRGSGLYECQLNFFSPGEYDPASGTGCFHVRRCFYASLFSRARAQYARAKRLVNSYRLMIGQDAGALDEMSGLEAEQYRAYQLCLAPFRHKKS